MDFELKDLLEALGPNAALIFAAWIFLSFLQQRYSNAYSRYRELIEAYRHGDRETPHMRSVRRQVHLYKERCQQMRAATTIGVWAAILIMVALIAGAFSVMFGENAVFKLVGSAGVIVGLALVIAAAAYVLRENRSIQEAIDDEPADLPELARDMSASVQHRHRDRTRPHGA